MITANRRASNKPRHAPRPALHIMAATIGKLRPDLGRQARAALCMDHYSMTFDDGVNGARTRFTDLPLTSPLQVLQELRAADHPA